MSSSSTTWTTDTNTKSGVVQIYESNVSVLKILGIEGGNSILELFADQGDDNADKWRMWVNASDDDLHFSNYTSGSAWTDILTLQDGGNVGIGTTSPLYDLHVNGASNSNLGISVGTADEARILSMNDDDDAYKALKFYGSSHSFVSGNVGIGVAAPDTELEIAHTDASTVSVGDLFTNSLGGIHISKTDHHDGGGSVLKFSADGDTNQAAIAHIAVNTSGDADLAFYTSDAVDAIIERMRIDNSGNVGIGTDSPDYPLEIEGEDASISQAITCYSATDTHLPQLIFQKSAGSTPGTPAATASGEDLGAILWKGVNTGGSFDGGAKILVEGDAAPDGDSVPTRMSFWTSDTSSPSQQRMTIDDAGNVGIGSAAPASGQGVNKVLHIADSTHAGVRIQDTGASDLELWSDTNSEIRVKTNNKLIFGTNDTQRMTIAAAGNVGIGTVTPTRGLHVVNSLVVKGRAAFELNGDINPGNSTTTVTGTSTKFTEEINVGDDIDISSEIRVVTAIASDTSLTIDTTFSDDIDADTTPYCNPAAFTVLRDDGSIGMVLDDDGFVGIGTSGPKSPLHVYSSGTTNLPILHVEHGETNMEADDEILRLDASLDVDIHTTQLKIITIHDAGGEIGKFVTASDGNINTAWTNVSDARLKKDIQDTSMDGLAIMNSIKLRDFKWNVESGKHRENKQVVGGLIADEVYEVYRQATTGTPGAVKEDGSIDRMGVTESQFITVMMKAIQELSAKVTALENA